jgi:hypothetical protein
MIMAALILVYVGGGAVSLVGGRRTGLTSKARRAHIWRVGWFTDCQTHEEEP